MSNFLTKTHFGKLVKLQIVANSLKQALNGLKMVRMSSAPPTAPSEQLFSQILLWEMGQTSNEAGA